MSTFKRTLTATEARFEAQRIAFGPVIFQVVQVMRRTGLLRALVSTRDWLDQAELERGTGLSSYATTVLLESALSAGVVERDEVTDVEGAGRIRWRTTAVGRFIERDPLVRINLDFIDDVCYRSLDHLETALVEGRPAGLKELGPWKTFYEGMAIMPEPARTSWFTYDHHYSDSAFPAALDVLATRHLQHVADVGANTGKFAIAYLHRVADSTVTLCDLPQQLQLAHSNLEHQGLLERARFHPCDLLNETSRLPEGEAAPDAFWMSQFVCCFSEDQIVGILKRAATAVRAGGSIFVLDTFWDDQRHVIAAYCLVNTSPYFATVANGDSRMYRLDVFLALASQAGLRAEKTWSDLGWCHTLIELRPLRSID